MAEQQLQLEIVTPESKVLSEEVEYVGLPGVAGRFGVMRNHIPYLSALAVGALYYRQGGKDTYIFVSGGFTEISSDHVSVLAESAERAEEIDAERARRAKERAEQRLREQTDEVDHARARAAMARALKRLECCELASKR